MKRPIALISKAAVAGVALAAMTSAAAAAKPQPFKLTNIHFETNSSACDAHRGSPPDGIHARVTNASTGDNDSRYRAHASTIDGPVGSSVILSRPAGYEPHFRARLIS
jgi:hypothetical protein